MTTTSTPSSTKNHTGGCHCGAVRYQAEIDPTAGSMCNCSVCTKLSTVGGMVVVIRFSSRVVLPGALRERADAFAILPGGVGTLDETFEILSWKQLGLHEGCIEQIDRLFRTRLGPGAPVDEAKRLRVDDWELSPEVQKEVSRRWPLLTTETMGELADLAEYKSQFLRLFGFGIEGVDYAQDVDPRIVPG